MSAAAYIALGSNLGDREAHIRFGLSELGRLPATRLMVCSVLVETEPLGPTPQPRFLNAAAGVMTTLAPRELLDALLAIEARRGRTRSLDQRWGPRTLDLDLLMYGDLVLDEPGMTIPHPRMHERRFVLEPLAQIAPNAVIPTLNTTVAEQLRALHATGAPR